MILHRIFLIIVILVMALYCYGHTENMPAKVLEKLQYCEEGPEIRIDNEGNWHLLYVGVNPRVNKYMSHDKLCYYKYDPVLNEFADSLIDHKNDGIHILDDLHLTNNGVVFFIYGYLSQYNLYGHHLVIIADESNHIIRLSRFEGIYNALLPEDRFLVLRQWGEKEFTIYDKHGKSENIGEWLKFRKQMRILPYRPCDKQVAVPEMLYLGDNLMMVASYCVSKSAGREWRDSCRMQVQIYLYDFVQDSIMAIQSVDLFSDPGVYATDLHYDKVSIIPFENGLFRIVCGRAYPDETGRLCLFTIDNKLNLVESTGITLKEIRGEVNYNSTSIDHQIFSLKPSKDSLSVGNLNRYVIKSDTIYYDISEPIYAKGKEIKRATQKWLQDQSAPRRPSDH